MGLFDIFSKKTETSQENTTVQTNIIIGTNKINLLKEREQKVGICLAKKTDIQIQARVNVMIDISGSMSGMFSSGKVQDVLERLFPIALKLDDNQELDIFAFNNSSKHIEPCVTISNFSDYVSKYFPMISGGTSYSPVMKEVVKMCEDDNSIPVFNIMLTDGDNGDKREAESFIREMSSKHHFWQFIGIGYESFDFLQELDTMSGRIIDNANFFSVNDISKISDEQLYDQLLNEFPTWLKEAKSKNIVK